MRHGIATFIILCLVSGFSLNALASSHGESSGHDKAAAPATPKPAPKKPEVPKKTIEEQVGDFAGYALTLIYTHEPKNYVQQLKKASFYFDPKYWESVQKNLSSYKDIAIKADILNKANVVKSQKGNFPTWKVEIPFSLTDVKKNKVDYLQAQIELNYITQELVINQLVIKPGKKPEAPIVPKEPISTKASTSGAVTPATDGPHHTTPAASDNKTVAATKDQVPTQPTSASVATPAGEVKKETLKDEKKTAEVASKPTDQVPITPISKPDEGASAPAQHAPVAPAKKGE